MADDEISARIDSDMAAWAQANNVPGLTWGVVKRGEGLVHGGFLGTADVGSGRKVEADTRFRIASMTKAFTALTLYDLAAEGRLRLDDHVLEEASIIRRNSPSDVKAIQRARVNLTESTRP